MYAPIKMKRSTKFGNNYWEDFSPKLKRYVSFFSDLEYEHWILVETNPLVHSFCEQPLKINYYFEGEMVETIPDMWIQYKTGEEEFVEVKYDSEINPNSSKAKPRSIRQIKVQELWCKENGFKHKVQTNLTIRHNNVFLSNMRILLPYLKIYKQPIEMDQHRLSLLLQNNQLSFSEIFESISSLEPSRILATLSWMYVNGIINGNFDSVQWGPKTKLWIKESK